MGRGTTAARAVGGLLLVALAAGAGCGEEPLVSVAERLRLSQPAVRFPNTYLGTTREQVVGVRNAGRAPVEVSWKQVQAPFSVEELPEQVGPAEVRLRVRFAPSAPGWHRATLLGTTAGGSTVALQMTGKALLVPPCPTPVACHGMSFDTQAERCVEAPLPDGTPCDPGNECLVQATCTAGRCQGRERVCDDGNACTTDVCNPLSGCQAVPAPPCPGDGVCQVGVCDPATGCGLARAPDGTFCGPRRGCEVADVCVQGACVERDLPDGSVCASATPCQGEGRCQGPVCERPPPTVLAPDWTWDAQARGQELHDMMVWPDGSVTLGGYFTSPVLDATGQGNTRSTPARRCLLWNEHLVCMDSPEWGTVSLAGNSASGKWWRFSLAQARPDLAVRASYLSVARLAVMGPDRLALVYEGYPAGEESHSTLCRVYFLAVLDAKGGLVSATQLEDALLKRCDHPHPFGTVSDAAGDVYLAFSPTVNFGTPLVAGSPTLVLAYSGDGVERWRRTLPVEGGELGVASGLLLPERARTALRTRDGVEVGALPVLGRAVATRQVLVPSPEGTSVNPGAGEGLSPELKGYAVADLVPAWTYRLGQGQRFNSKELRLADTLPHGGEQARTLVLGFMEDGTTPTLVGVRADDGSEAFRCALGYTPRTVPQLFELGPESLVMMDGAQTCGECDSPFARSKARFQRFVLRGLGPSQAPWPGTFGGPGHDHHEGPVRASP